MDYRESKIKGIIREGIVQYEEDVFMDGVKQTNNPYATLQDVQLKHDIINRQVEAIYLKLFLEGYLK